MFKHALLEFDAWLLSFAGAVGAFIQQWAGVDCLDQARFAWRLGWLAFVCRTALHGEWGWFAFGVLPCLMGTLSDPEDAQIRQDALRGFRNRRQLNKGMAWSRYMWLFISVIDSALDLAILAHGQHRPDWMSSLPVHCLTISAWLRCCDPLPPCKGKIREWWKSLGKQQVPAQVPA
jgi:hypothetical protein